MIDTSSLRTIKLDCNLTLDITFGYTFFSQDVTLNFCDTSYNLILRNLTEQRKRVNVLNFIKISLYKFLFHTNGFTFMVKPKVSKSNYYNYSIKRMILSLYVYPI